MIQSEREAGDGQTIVVYQGDDTGTEIDAGALMDVVAADAAERDRRGRRIAAMTSIPQRHSGAYLGREGSGYETKTAIIVVYAAT